MAYCLTHEYEYPEKYVNVAGRTFQVGACPECDKEEVEKEKLSEEEGRRSSYESLNRRCNIEPMFYDSTLGNFEAVTQEQTRALEYARAMVQEKAGKLVLLGSNGTGKTHIAVSVVRELSGSIFSMYEITTRIRASYVSGAKETELDIVDELARRSMLAIDEIGRTKGSDAETNWLSYIIDKRHTRGLPIILISNKHTRKTCPEKGCQNCLENFISEDVMSRLAEDGHLVSMTGDDYRKKKRNQ